MRANFEFPLLFAFLVVTVAQENLLENLNYDFEVDSGDPDFFWVPHKDCTFETVNISYTGSSSLRVSNRVDNQSSPTLLLDQSLVQPGKSYHYSIYVNFLNTPSELMNFNTTLKIRRKIPEDTGFIYVGSTIGNLKYQRGGTGWQYFGADIRLPTEDFEEIRFFMEFDQRVDFLVDTAVLVELPQPDPATWKDQLNTTITAERTNLITIQSNISSPFDPSQTVIQVDQTLNSFHFGAGIKVGDFVDETSNFSVNYRKFFYDNFNMGVPANAVKWKQMEKTEGVYSTENLNLALDEFEQRGVNSRGHNIIWGQYDTQPTWLVDYSADPIGDPVEIRKDVEERIRWYCENYGTRFIHHDVYNEYVHFQFYEEVLQDPDFILDVFQDVQDACAGMSFFNDFSIMSRGTYTSAEVNAVNMVLNAGIRVDAIGAQSHIDVDEYETTYPELLEKRTDVLCSTGVSLAITEFDVQGQTPTEKASKLEEMLMFYYSKPCIIGVVYWSLSDQNVLDPTATLLEGEDAQPNEAGLMWNSLVKGQWETHQTLTPTDRSESFQFRGHHGDYNVTVIHSGEVIQTSSFTLTKGQDVVVPVNL